MSSHYDTSSSSTPALSVRATSPSRYILVEAPREKPSFSTSSVPLHTSVTHVNSSMVNMSGSSGKRGRSRKGRELSVSTGNDAPPPWLKPKGTRGYQISTVEGLPATNFLTSNTGLPTFTATAFTISQVNDFTSFSAVFDQYKIDLIEVWIEPQVTETTAAAADVGTYTTVIDVDDASAPTSNADLQSYSSVVQTKGTQSHYHRFVPSVAVAVYSGTFTSFAATTSMWLDCGSPNIQHYGIKAASTTAAAIQTYTIQAKLHVSWRARH